MERKTVDVTWFVKILSLIACAIMISGAYTRLSFTATFQKFIMSFYMM